MSAEPVYYPQPRNHGIHSLIKQIADRLRPHLIYLNERLSDKSSDIFLYQSVILEVEKIKNEVSNHDCLCAIQNAINHLEKAIELSQNSAMNEEILWHLQEVMALFFKIQNLPS